MARFVWRLENANDTTDDLHSILKYNESDLVAWLDFGSQQAIILWSIELENHFNSQRDEIDR